MENQLEKYVDLVKKTLGENQNATGAISNISSKELTELVNSFSFLEGYRVNEEFEVVSSGEGEVGLSWTVYVTKGKGAYR